MADNHIGTAFEILKDVADAMGYNYSYGDLTRDPERAKEIYPLLHCTLLPIQVGRQASNMQINILLMDVVNHLATEDEGLDPSVVYSTMGYTENQNFAAVLQQIYVAFNRELYRVQYDRYEEIKFAYPYTMDPFIEATEDVVAGFRVTLTIQLKTPAVTDGRC